MHIHTLPISSQDLVDVIRTHSMYANKCRNHMQVVLEA